MTNELKTKKTVKNKTNGIKVKSYTKKKLYTLTLKRRLCLLIDSEGYHVTNSIIYEAVEFLFENGLNKNKPHNLKRTAKNLLWLLILRIK